MHPYARPGTHGRQTPSIFENVATYARQNGRVMYVRSLVPCIAHPAQAVAILPPELSTPNVKCNPECIALIVVDADACF